MLVDEAEDSQVTSLVQKLLCGETFKTEDFPGGDRSFCPKLEVRDAGQEEKGCPIPIHQRNLRPRKAVSVEVEEVSSSGNSEEGNPPCSETCTHENLKRWMSERFEKLENMFEELHTVVCRSFGSIRMSCRKRVHPDLGRMISQKQTSLTMVVCHDPAKTKAIR
ncbi:hypothetical protein Bca52824_023790 [Brassica carinata]|uniref:Uncharacterized protein n=1 Tax=Brassica carinata TaxID=52824 RepID=A0A8X8AV13_BRACI|nr:hypothetical protein Bca52824_023790 [Brassica carinata]